MNAVEDISMQTLRANSGDEEPVKTMISSKDVQVVCSNEIEFAGPEICTSWAAVTFQGCWRGTSFAVKVRGCDDARDSFDRELTHASTRHRHPNVVHLFGVAYFDSGPSLVYEHCGECFDTILLQKRKDLGKACKPPLVLALSWAQQLFGAVEFLHSTAQRSHRDIKLSNLVLSADQKTLKLAEFSKVVSVRDLDAIDDDDNGLRFASPEIAGSSASSAAWDKADIYAATVSMWCMLKGQLPFEHVGNAKVVMMMAAKGARPPYAADKQGVDTILMAGWGQEPQSRPAAEKMAERVEAVLSREKRRGKLWQAIRGKGGDEWK